MGPTELEDMLDEEPFRPVRLTLTNGYTYVVHRREQAVVGSLAVILYHDPDPDVLVARDYRLLSIPNIILAERVNRSPEGRRWR